MQIHLLISFIAMNLMFSNVYGDQLHSGMLLKRATVPALYERQACSADEIACSGGFCCSASDTCGTTGCIATTGLTTCTGAGEESCGTYCCDSPLVCSSSLQCVEGSNPQHGTTFIRAFVLISGIGSTLKPMVSIICGLGFIAIMFAHYA
jgi:hypothetical protein